MLCPECAKENPEGGEFCVFCGAALSSPLEPPARPRTSGMAIASFVLGLLGFLCVTAMAGLVLGIVSLVQIRRSQRRLRGEGLAIAGICLSALTPIFATLPVMLFPVYMRARESERKAICLSNVKNIALAFQMYIADNDDTLPPLEHRAEALEYFDGDPGGGRAWDPRREQPLDPDQHCPTVHMANPYLRWPVILDEYVMNREVWRCPSAQLQMPARFINGDIDWLGHLRAREGQWGEGSGLCVKASYPAGWGGEVTDSLSQRRLAVPLQRPAGTPHSPETGPMTGRPPEHVFVQSIAVNGSAAELKLAQVANLGRYVICADGGATVEDLSAGTLAFPDLCALECANDEIGWVDWEICAAAADCGLYNHAPNDGSFLLRPELRQRYARHLGGVNIGFLDGHAQWMNSETLLQDLRYGDVEGVTSWGPTSDDPWVSGVPTLY